MSEKVHARLGASGAKRWMTCPGSIALSEGMPDVSSIFAEEGDRAHDLAELALNEGLNTEAYIGTEINGVAVDEDMATHVQKFVDHCREFMGGEWQWWVEKKFSLAPLDPPEPMFGTSDFTAYHPVRMLLKVADLKYGMGVIVEIADNVQTLYYALGLALDLFPLPITEIELTIVQPRVSHPDGIIRTVTISYLELIEFAGKLLKAARATQEPNAPLVPGEHCRFCPASGACPAQQQQALEVAQMDFAIEESVPPSIEAIPIELLAEWFPKMEILKDWIKAAEQRVRLTLEAGEEVPGYKLVATRPSRKWADPEGAEAWLTKESGLVESDIYEPRELRSVPKIEKAMKKKAFNNSPLAGMVVKQSSGTKVVPNSDPAPALIVTAGTEFLALPAGDSTQDKQQGDS